jgi:16S rRNA processing protein RimM
VDRAAKRLTTEQEWGSGGQGRAPEPRYLTVGIVVGAHGLRGELKVEILTQDPHRFRLLKRVLIGLEDQEPVPWPLKGYRLHQGRALLQLEGCEDRTTAETLRGHLVQVPLEEAIPLGEDEYYEHQILGLGVWTVSGEYLGEIVEILYTGANDVYVIQSEDPGRGEILIPAIEGVVLEVELAAGRLVIELPEGLL